MVNALYYSNKFIDAMTIMQGRKARANVHPQQDNSRYPNVHRQKCMSVYLLDGMLVTCFSGIFLWNDSARSNDTRTLFVIGTGRATQRPTRLPTTKRKSARIVLSRPFHATSASSGPRVTAVPHVLGLSWCISDPHLNRCQPTICSGSHSDVAG